MVTFLHTTVFPTTAPAAPAFADSSAGVVEELERAWAEDTGKAASRITAINARLKRILGSLIVFMRTILLGIVEDILNPLRNSSIK
jgi:hypothetical protein